MQAKQEKQQKEKRKKIKNRECVVKKSTRKALTSRWKMILAENGESTFVLGMLTHARANSCGNLGHHGSGLERTYQH